MKSGWSQCSGLRILGASGFRGLLPGFSLVSRALGCSVWDYGTSVWAALPILSSVFPPFRRGVCLKRSPNLTIYLNHTRPAPPPPRKLCTQLRQTDRLQASNSPFRSPYFDGHTPSRLRLQDCLGYCRMMHNQQAMHVSLGHPHPNNHNLMHPEYPRLRRVGASTSLLKWLSSLALHVIM